MTEHEIANKILEEALLKLDDYVGSYQLDRELGVESDYLDNIMQTIKNELPQYIKYRAKGNSYGASLCVPEQHRNAVTQFLSIGGFLKEKRDLELKQKAEGLDKILHLLSAAKFRKYYSIEKLRIKIPAFRLWSDAEFKESIEIIAGISPQIHYSDNSKIDHHILWREKNGLVKYKYNPRNYKTNKQIKKILLSLKTPEERRAYRMKEFEAIKLEREVYFWKSPQFWFGLISGIITTGLGALGLYLSWIKNN